MNFEYRTFGFLNPYMKDTEDIAPVCLVVENSKDTATIPLYCFEHTMQAIAKGFWLDDRMINGFLVPLNVNRIRANPDTKYIYEYFSEGMGLGRFKYKEDEYIVGPGLLYDIMAQQLLVLVCKKVFFEKTNGILSPVTEEISFFIDPSFLAYGKHPIRRKIINKLDRAAYDYKVYVRHLDNLSTSIIHKKPLCRNQQDKIRNRAGELASHVLSNLLLSAS